MGNTKPQVINLAIYSAGYYGPNNLCKAEYGKLKDIYTSEVMRLLTEKAKFPNLYKNKNNVSIHPIKTIRNFYDLLKESLTPIGNEKRIMGNIYIIGHSNGTELIFYANIIKWVYSPVPLVAKKQLGLSLSNESINFVPPIAHIYPKISDSIKYNKDEQEEELTEKDENGKPIYIYNEDTRMMDPKPLKDPLTNKVISNTDLKPGPIYLSCKNDSTPGILNYMHVNIKERDSWKVAFAKLLKIDENSTSNSKITPESKLFLFACKSGDDNNPNNSLITLLANTFGINTYGIKYDLKIELISEKNKLKIEITNEVKNAIKDNRVYFTVSSLLKTPNPEDTKQVSTSLDDLLKKTTNPDSSIYKNKTHIDTLMDIPLDSIFRGYNKKVNL